MKEYRRYTEDFYNSMSPAQLLIWAIYNKGQIARDIRDVEDHYDRREEVI